MGQVKVVVQLTGRVESGHPSYAPVFDMCRDLVNCQVKVTSHHDKLWSSQCLLSGYTLRLIQVTALVDSMTNCSTPN